MRAAPAVSRAMGSGKRTRAYRFSGGTPAFPAQWLYGLYVLSPATNFLFATVASGLRFVKARSGRRISAGLTSATDARTTRLRRTQRPHPPLQPARCRCEVLKKALKRRSSAQRKIAHGRTRPATTIAPDAAASTASSPAFVTIAIRPSCRGGRAE